MRRSKRKESVFRQLKTWIQSHPAIRLRAMLILLHHVFALLVVHLLELTLRLHEEADPASSEFAVGVRAGLLFLSGHLFRRVTPH